MALPSKGSVVVKDGKRRRTMKEVPACALLHAEKKKDATPRVTDVGMFVCFLTQNALYSSVKNKHDMTLSQ